MATTSIYKNWKKPSQNKQKAASWPLSLFNQQKKEENQPSKLRNFQKEVANTVVSPKKRSAFPKKEQMLSRTFATTKSKLVVEEKPAAIRKTTKTKTAARVTWGESFGKIGLLLASPFIFIALLIWNNLLKKFNREVIAYFIFLAFFVSLINHLANLQVVGSENDLRSDEQTLSQNLPIINSQRGQIYIRDFGRSREKIPLTTTKLLASLTFDPFELKNGLKRGLNLNDVSVVLASSLNLPLQEIYQSLKVETDKENPGRYAVLEKLISNEQKEAITYLQSRTLTDKNKKLYQFGAWVRVDELASRSYPEGSLLAATVGFVTKNPIPVDERFPLQCLDMVNKNKERGTNKEEYVVGYWGLEQKYCSLLGGINGRALLNSERKDNQKDEETRVIHGTDIYLTIDRTLQQKAEEVLEKAIKDNANKATGKLPRNGSITVMDPQTGKILASASYPFFDPNKYNEVENPEAFRNVGSSEDYEVGSSMKPLTVAAALNEYQSGNRGSQGQLLGISPNWSKVDYPKGIKFYKEQGKEIDKDTPRVTNSQDLGYDWRTNDLKLVIRDSINTMISDITDSMGNAKLKEYFEDKFLFDRPTAATFAGSSGGQNANSSFDANLGCQICYANHGFGQGFAITPIQLMRAYTALANDGKLVEPYIIEKVVDQDGNVDDGTSENSLIKRPAPYPILSSQSVRLVTGYMQAVIDEGYLGQTPGKNQIPGYSVAAKTGTAQIGRPIITKDENGKEIQINCPYKCNTERGLFDHSLIGFGPTTNAKVMVMVKISEPNPGETTNFADRTTMPAFKEMMQFSLEYLGVAKDR